jgi:hypothetical protein
LQIVEIHTIVAMEEVGLGKTGKFAAFTKRARKTIVGERKEIVIYFLFFNLNDMCPLFICCAQI